MEQNAESRLGGGLLAVRLLGRFDPPAALRADIASGAGLDTVSIGGRLQQSIPGQYADYLFALALPAGRYALKAVRDTNASVVEPLAVLDAALDLSQPDPVYLGRLVLNAARDGKRMADLGIEDHYENDTLLFRATVPELRNVTIRRGVLGIDVPLSLTLTADLVSREQMTVTPINAQSASGFSPAARAGFAQFMRLRPPRAFAVSVTGAFGHAQGRDAVERAMTNCARRAKGAACRLLAVDQTFVERPPCGTGSTAPDSPVCKSPVSPP